MVKVLLEHAATGDWSRALALGIPERKRDENLTDKIASSSASSNRAAIVLGACSAAGRAFVRQLAADGWEVLAVARDAKALDAAMTSVREELEAEKSKAHVIVAFPADIRDTWDVDQLRLAIVRRFGWEKVTLAVHCVPTLAWDDDAIAELRKHIADAGVEVRRRRGSGNSWTPSAYVAS